MGDNELIAYKIVTEKQKEKSKTKKKKTSTKLPKFKCPFCNYIFSEKHEGELGILNMYGFSKDTKIKPNDKELTSIELKNLIVCPNCDKYFERDLKSKK